MIRALAALACLAALLAPAAALAREAPDAAALERLRTDAMTRHRFRVVTRRGEYFVSVLEADGGGVVLRKPQARPALFVGSPSDPGETRRAAWADVERIEGQKPQALKGGVIGGAIGAGLGAWLFAWVDHNYSDANGHVFLIPIGAALGGLTGAVIGGTTGWKTIYP